MDIQERVNKTIEALERLKYSASERQDYELAATFRDLRDLLKHGSKQRII